MPLLARQASDPSGLLGRLVGHGMAAGNRDLNRWVVQCLGALDLTGDLRIAELGPGPGVALQRTLKTFPQATVWALEPSRQMRLQSVKRNRAASVQGRLTVMAGGVENLAEIAPFDVVYAVHVLYFWSQPALELTRIHAALAPGGAIALGYRLRGEMPAGARRGFPRHGFRLYDTDADVDALLSEAGFADIEHWPEPVIGAGPGGRVTIARRDR